MQKRENIPSGPYEVFLHLMMMSMMIVSVFCIITLIVQYIDLIFPDELIWYGGTYDVIRYSSSALLVSFPVFLLNSWLIAKDLRKDPEKKNIMIRRWLIYLALFIASLTIVIDLIQFVDRFYSGELSLPFSLKVLAVFVISAIVFAYFKWDLDRDHEKTVLAKSYAIISSLALLFVLGIGVVFAGSPQHQRQVRFDEERIRDLEEITYEVGEYWRQKKVLPQALSDLERDIHYFDLPTDPGTGELYSYEIIDDLSFQLCATFDLETQLLPNEASTLKQWYHEEGHTCFERGIDPDFFKSLPETR